MINNCIQIDGRTIVFSATKKAIGYIVKGMDTTDPASPTEIKGFSFIEANENGSSSKYKRQFKVIPNPTSTSLKITPSEGRKAGELLNIWLAENELNNTVTNTQRTVVTVGV